MIKAPGWKDTGNCPETLSGQCGCVMSCGQEKQGHAEGSDTRETDWGQSKKS